MSGLLVSIMISLFASITIASFWNDFTSGEIMPAAVMGGLVFCVLLTAITLNRLFKIKKQLNDLQRGLQSYEMQMAKKFDGLKAKLPQLDRIERIERKLATQQETETYKAQEGNIIAHLARVDEDENASQIRAAELSDDQKIIQLYPNKDSKNASVTKTKSSKKSSSINSDKTYCDVNAKKAKSFSIDGIKIRLQPAVSLDSREILAFEVSACIEDRFGGLHDADEIQPMLLKDKDIRAFDIEVANQTMSLIRSLRRQGKSPIVFASISAKTIKSTPTFNSFLENLHAQRQLSENIVWQIAQSDYKALSKSCRQRLSEIKELGFELCLYDCTEEDDAADTILKGLFKYAKMPAQELENKNFNQITAPVPELMVACNKMDATLIMTHVEHERQAIHLIDHNLPYAQGGFFSPPKFANTSNNATQTAS